MEARHKIVDEIVKCATEADINKALQNLLYLNMNTPDSNFMSFCGRLHSFCKSSHKNKIISSSVAKKNVNNLK